MKIAGMQKVSMVDYPGNICATVFTQGCNFRCGFCHNSVLMEAETDTEFTEDKALSYFKDRKNFLDGVCITGGEPTLWADLAGFAAKIKDLGLKLKLDTNGSNPQVLRNLLDKGLLDFIAMDVKTSIEKYHLFKIRENTGKNILESIKQIMDSGGLYEFRTTCVPGIVTEKDIENISEMIKGAKAYSLQQFRAHENVLDKKYATLRSYTPDVFDKFKSLAEKYIDNVTIRGL